jgi:hypothetical protein
MHVRTYVRVCICTQTHAYIHIYSCACNTSAGYSDVPETGGFCAKYYLLEEDAVAMPADLEERTSDLVRVRMHVHTYT